MPEYTKRCRWFDIVRHQFGLTMLPFKGKPVRYLEVGCFEGMSTIWMLENILTHPDAQAVTIDPWWCSYSKRLDWVAVEARARQNLAPYEGKVQIVKGSWPDVKDQVAGIFDAIYIDSSHERDTAYHESVAAWPILNPGGIMLWDDYRNAVVEVVDNFLATIPRCYQVVSRGSQLHVRKISDSPVSWLDFSS